MIVYNGGQLFAKNSPFVVSGIRIEQRNGILKKIWSSPDLIDALPTIDGVYLLCVKNSSGAAKSVEIRRNILLNNTELWRCHPWDEHWRIPEGLRDLVKLVSKDPRSFHYFILEPDRKQILSYRNPVEENRCLEWALPPEILVQVGKEIEKPTRIVKIGVAENRNGIKGRIKSYRRCSYPVTRYALLESSKTFRELEWYTLDTAELNQRMQSVLEGWRPITSADLERDLILLFREEKGYPPAWEQQHRYSAEGNWTSSNPVYRKTLLDLFEKIDSDEGSGSGLSR